MHLFVLLEFVAQVVTAISCQVALNLQVSEAFDCEQQFTDFDMLTVLLSVQPLQNTEDILHVLWKHQVVIVAFHDQVQILTEAEVVSLVEGVHT